MSAGRLGIAGDENVEPLLAVQLRTALNGEGELAVIGLTLHQQSTGQRLAELIVQRRNSSGLGYGWLRPHGFCSGCFAPGAVFWFGGRRCIIELRDEPFQTVEVVEQSAFGVFIGVVEDADRPAVAAGADLAQDLHVLGADAEREDFAAFGVACDVHAVEVEAEQMRFHGLDGLR